jgi:hypothetical protein
MDELARLRAALAPFAAVANAAIEHDLRLPPDRLIAVSWDRTAGTLLRWSHFEAAIAALEPRRG